MLWFCSHCLIVFVNTYNQECIVPVIILFYTIYLLLNSIINTRRSNKINCCLIFSGYKIVWKIIKSIFCAINLENYWKYNKINLNRKHFHNWIDEKLNCGFYFSTEIFLCACEEKCIICFLNSFVWMCFECKFSCMFTFLHQVPVYWL